MKKTNEPAAITAVCFLTVSLVWLGLTHGLVLGLGSTQEDARYLANVSFIGFVLVSSVMLFYLVRRHVKRALKHRNELITAQEDLIRLLAQAGDWRDSETGDHVERVSSFAFEVAAECGLTVRQCEIVRLAATTHDIGKIGVSDSVVKFTGVYDIAQRAEMQAHTLIGGQIMRGGTGELAETARRTALCHHEWWDGTGYPAGLKGDEIHIAARITAIADVFDALISPRRYKESWTWDAACAQIAEGAGKQFDPRVVAAFVRAHDRIRQVWVQSLASAPLADSTGGMTLVS